MAGDPARQVVLEGGSIDVDGAGTLLTTEECLLSPIQARNPELTREQLDIALADYLGIRKVIWLGDGIAGDDTHGHVDDLARFVGNAAVRVPTVNDPADRRALGNRADLFPTRKVVGSHAVDRGWGLGTLHC